MPRIQKKEEPKSRLRKFLIGCGIGCGSTVALLLLIAAILYHQITAKPAAIPGGASSSASAPAPAGGAGQTPGAPSAPGAAPGPGAVPGAPPLPPAQAQIDEIKRAVQSNQAQPVSLRLSEGQLNDYIAQKAGGGAIRNARVTLRSGDMVVSGTALWNGREIYVTAYATPQAVSGRLAIRVDAVEVGRLPLPSSAVARIQAEIDKGLASDDVMGRGVQVTSVSIANGELALSGQTVPR